MKSPSFLLHTLLQSNIILTLAVLIQTAILLLYKRTQDGKVANVDLPSAAASVMLLAT